MMFFLISYTQGKTIELIPAYAEEAKADICIHAGDFGFYDSASLDALSNEEIRLLVRHSILPDEQKAVLDQTPPEERKEALKQNHLLGCFPDFLEEKKQFERPVYATWGNHDDAEIVLRLIKDPIANLRILHEKTFFDLGDIVLLGVGGNCVPHKAFTQNCKKGLPGAQCRPTSVFSQYVRLLKTARTVPADKHIILVTHVSPLVEPFLELLVRKIGAALTISGHMGRPNGETGITDRKRLPVLRRHIRKWLNFILIRGKIWSSFARKPKHNSTGTSICQMRRMVMAHSNTQTASSASRFVEAIIEKKWAPFPYDFSGRLIVADSSFQCKT